MGEPYDPASIAERVTQTVAVWESCAEADMPEGRKFTVDEQQQREHAYDNALSAVEQELETASPKTRADCAGMEQRIRDASARFSASALHLEAEALRVLNEELKFRPGRGDSIKH